MNRIGKANILLVCGLAAGVAAVLWLPGANRAFSQSDEPNPDTLRAEKYERVNRVLPELLDRLELARPRETTYVKIGDIKGGSVDMTHYEWIEALYVGYGISQAAIGRTGKVSGKPDFSQVTLVKDVDQATPFLAVACAEGRKIEQVDVHFTQALPDRRGTYLRMTLHDVILVAVTPILVREGGRSIHVEEVSLQYGRVEWEFTPFDERGRARTPLSTACEVR